MVEQEFPAVRLIRMPHSRSGACETFNIGFRAATQEFTVILDDDVVLPDHWIATMLAEFAREPATTALLTSKVREPEMPEWHLSSPEVNRPRYLATFRGCASLARSAVLAAAGYYDERFFIFGNERDLAARILNLGLRIKLVPAAEVFHKAPFGMRQGKRSLYYHIRNFWLYAFKYVPWIDVVRFPFMFLRKKLGKKSGAEVSDAVGTIGLFENIRAVKGGWWVVVKAHLSALWNLPYCLKRRAVCRSPDFRLPLT
jgi:GT2 family glycosyltransferase